MKAVAYYRVSTTAQGRSGLGLDAQRLAIDNLVRQRNLALLTEFTEVESGRRNSRPQLAAALNQAKLTGSVLVIAKLDRLSRNAAFLLALRDSGVRFMAADIPDANDLTIGVLAVIAQAEREAISRRTKEALAIIKQRLTDGQPYTSLRSGRQISRLGNPNGTKAIQAARKANDNAIAAVKAGAIQRAWGLKGILEHCTAAGMASPHAIARHLNDVDILTARGGRWHPSTVRNMLHRLGHLEQQAESPQKMMTNFACHTSDSAGTDHEHITIEG